MMEKSSIKTLLLAGLLVGFLDGMTAVIQTLLNNGNPIKTFQFIASGIFGTGAFSGGNMMAAMGLLFHFSIAMIWTLILFFLNQRLKLYLWNWLITGMLYGILVWIGMNFIVLPLSRTPAIPFTISGSIKSISILIVAVGLPISFIAWHHYNNKQSQH